MPPAETAITIGSKTHSRRPFFLCRHIPARKAHITNTPRVSQRGSTSTAKGSSAAQVASASISRTHSPANPRDVSGSGAASTNVPATLTSIAVPDRTTEGVIPASSIMKSAVLGIFPRRRFWLFLSCCKIICYYKAGRDAPPRRLFSAALATEPYL